MNSDKHYVINIGFIQFPRVILIRTIIKTEATTKRKGIIGSTIKNWDYLLVANNELDVVK